MAALHGPPRRGVRPTAWVCLCLGSLFWIWSVAILASRRNHYLDQLAAVFLVLPVTTLLSSLLFLASAVAFVDLHRQLEREAKTGMDERRRLRYDAAGGAGPWISLAGAAALVAVMVLLPDRDFGILEGYVGPWRFLLFVAPSLVLAAGAGAVLLQRRKARQLLRGAA